MSVVVFGLFCIQGAWVRVYFAEETERPGFESTLFALSGTTQGAYGVSGGVL